MALNAGTRLGQYQVLSAIGAGGMGEIYRAMVRFVRHLPVEEEVSQ
jgi:hypothetical protein